MQRSRHSRAFLTAGLVALGSLSGLARGGEPTEKEKLARVQALEWARDPSVAALLTDASPAVRRAAARACGRIAAPGDEIAAAESGRLAALVTGALWNETDGACRREQLLALGQAGTPEAARELVEWRDGPSLAGLPPIVAEDRLAAATALRFAATEADRHSLVRGLLHGEAEVRRESALAIGILEKRARAAGARVHDAATVRALVDVLPSSRIDPLRESDARGDSPRFATVYALAQIADAGPDVRERLARIFAGSVDADVLTEAARGLARSAVGAVASGASPEIAVGEGDPHPSREGPFAAEAKMLDVLSRQTDDARVAGEVVRALAKHRADASARARLVAYLDHASFHARKAACEALAVPPALAGTQPAAELDALAKKLEDPYVSVRGAALEALAKRDPVRALPLAKPFVESKEAQVRVVVAGALGALLANPDTAGPARAALERLVQDEKVHRVRTAALAALGESEQGALALALGLAASETDPGVLEGALDLVAKGLDSDPRCEAALAACYERVRGQRDAFEAREGILTALGERGDKLGDAGRKALELAQSDPVPSVAYAAQKAIASVRGVKAPEAPRRERKVAVEPVDFQGKKPVLVFETTRGSFEVELYPEDAPLHCSNVWRLASSSFYDGLSWHRVVSSFVIQGGDPRGDGTGDPGYTIPDELSARPYVRGTLGMPKTAVKDTGGCQLFFTHGRTPHLDGRYTVFGQIRKGVEVIDLIEEGDRITSVKAHLE